MHRFVKTRYKSRLYKNIADNLHLSTVKFYLLYFIDTFRLI